MKKIFSIFFLCTLIFIYKIERANAYYEINQDTTWTNEQSPIVINDYIWVKPGITLTIDPGVIVKMTKNQFFIVGGVVLANGTKDNPVIFTSVKDDEHGGDSNADGNDSTPNSGDWAAMNVSGKIIFDHVIIQYGGRFYNSPTSYTDLNIISIGNLSSATTTNLILRHNTGGINNSGIFFIKNSAFLDNYSKIGASSVNFGIKSTKPVEAKNNWWGSAEGPCAYEKLVAPGTPYYLINFQEICGEKPIVNNTVNYEPWLLTDQLEEFRIDPVIIIPGILGSWEKDGKWLIDPILHTYDNLIDALLQNGYTLDNNLFLFPYNWRKSNIETAELLKTKITDIKNITGTKKVDIVAHSMGGLVARQYIESDSYENDVDQLIFLDTPHAGAPESYLMYEAGYFWGNSLSSLFKKFYFQFESLENGYFNLNNYIKKEITSIQQLLPNYNYLINESNEQERIYPEDYPQNIFLDILNSETNIIKLKNNVRINNFVSDYNFQGEYATLNKIVVNNNYNEWEHGKPACIDTENNSCFQLQKGDGTVPSFSLNFIKDIELTEYANVSHSEIPNKAQSEVVELLSNIRPEKVSVSPWGVIKRLLFIRAYSPIDFNVMDPEHKMIGKDFELNIEKNEIEGAYYNGFSSKTEFATIINPLPGKYVAKVQGIASGKYKLAIDLIEENNSSEQSKERSIMGIAREGEISVLNFDISTGTPELIINRVLTPDDIINDLEMLFEQKEIKKKFLYNSLYAKLKHIKEKYATILSTEKDLKKELTGRYIEFFVNKILKNELKFYFSKKLITEDAYNILNYDLDNLLLNI